MPACGWQFEHSYQTLPSRMYAAVRPQLFARLTPLVVNDVLAQQLQVLPQTQQLHEAIQALAQGHPSDPMRPIAQAYAGHQFGHFTVLGDGRAMLLGEHRTPQGSLVDIQLKGAGPTPYSRRGDGLATQSAMLREYLMGEAMHALGIPTSRALAVFSTGERVRRQGPQLGAVLVRVASSHLRVGTFEFAAIDHPDTVKQLTTYAMQRHDPSLVSHDDAVLRFFENVLDRQAQLVARWMSVGFVHGVMNTDNVSIAGETIDYGPCAFLDEYDPAAVFSSIDHNGRYAFGNQPNILFWNLCRLAETLLPLIHSDEDQAVEAVQQVLSTFPQRYELYWQHHFCQKIGFDQVHPDAVACVKKLLTLMQQHRLDFTHTFRQLAHGRTPDVLIDWTRGWQALRLQQQMSDETAQALMQRVNPAVIARNHEVESLLAQMDEAWDASAFERFVRVLQNPFASEHETHVLAQPRPQHVPPVTTYCGT